MIETAAEVDNILLENKVWNITTVEPFSAVDTKRQVTRQHSNFVQCGSFQFLIGGIFSVMNLRRRLKVVNILLENKSQSPAPDNQW